MLLNATISFPNLGIEIEKLNRFVNIFGVDIAYYGIIIAAAIFLATCIALYNAKRSGQDTEDYIDLAIFVYIFAIVGARLYYVIFNFDIYKEDLMAIFNVRQGGLAIYGGIIGGALALFVVSKHKKLSFLKFADTVVPALALGQAIGRWGNFINREAYGGPTDSLFAMKIDVNDMSAAPTVETIDAAGRYIQVHPTFLYESVCNIIIFAILMVLFRKKKYDGQIMLMYFVGYGIARFIIEGMRTDQLMLFGTGIAVSQGLSLVLAIFGITMLVYNKVKNK